jgi:hypothetical protein
MCLSESNPGNSARTTYRPSCVDSSIRIVLVPENGHGLSNHAARAGNADRGLVTGEFILTRLVVAYPHTPDGTGFDAVGLLQPEGPRSPDPIDTSPVRALTGSVA